MRFQDVPIWDYIGQLKVPKFNSIFNHETGGFNFSIFITVFPGERRRFCGKLVTTNNLRIADSLFFLKESFFFVFVFWSLSFSETLLRRSEVDELKLRDDTMN